MKLDNNKMHYNRVWEEDGLHHKNLSRRTTPQEPFNKMDYTTRTFQFEEPFLWVWDEIYPNIIGNIIRMGPQIM